MPKHTAAEREKRLARQEKKTSRRVLARVNSDITKASQGQGGGERYVRGQRARAARLTPGEKARVRNLKRHGKQVPVSTKGKIDNRSPSLRDLPKKKKKKKKS